MKKYLILIIIGGWFWLGLTQAEAASLYFSPSSGNRTVEQAFSVAVKISAGGVAVNAAEGTVSFPASLLNLNSVTRSGSIFSLWTVNPTGSNSSATVTFSGGLPSPGFSSNAGTVVTMSFTPRTTGTAKLSLSGSRILANDGQGTNIITGVGSATFTLVEPSASSPTPDPTRPSEPTRITPTLSSTTHPDQNTWYQGDQADLSFTKPSGLLGVSFGLTDVPDSVPDEVPDPTGDSITVALPGDGVWYFHLRARYANGWSTTAHFTLRRDTTPPEPFEITLDRDRGGTDPSPVITFAAKDAASGVSQYRLEHNGQDMGEVSSPVTLEILTGGEQKIVITAIDAAGNEQTAELTFESSGYPAPILTGVTDRLVLLDRLTVTGTAQAGDTVIIYVDDEEVTRFMVGEKDPEDTTLIRLPWRHTSERIFGPGWHTVAAAALSTDGRMSVTSDPLRFHVNGTAIALGGRVIAAWAFAPWALAVTLLILTLIIGVNLRLYLVVRAMHRREALVDKELHTLQHQLLRSKLTLNQVESTIEQIENDLKRPIQIPLRPKKRPPPK